MILSLSVIITNITICYLVFSFKKYFKQYIFDSQENMIKLNENSLKDFIKEIRRHEEQYHNFKTVTHSTKTEYDPRETPGYKPGTNPFVKGTSHYKKWQEHNRPKRKVSEKQRKAASETMKRIHAERRKKAAQKQPSLEVYKEFIRPGELTIQ